MDREELRLAVLIDADNAPRTALREIMAEVAIYGNPTLKRIYGDWTAPNMGSWKDRLLEHAISPVQQYSYTTGKNATDSAMIIDAMDILYSGQCDGFVLVSSDSDFTRLATRLREAGMKVYGMGEHKTPAPFIASCDKFIYIEVLRAAAEEATEKPSEKPAPGKAPQKPAKTAKKKEESSPEPVPEPEPPQKGVPAEIVALIADSLNSIADEDGYAFMGELGNLLVKKMPNFDPRNFGFGKLTTLVKSLDRFEVDVRQSTVPHVKHIYLRDKQSK